MAVGYHPILPLRINLHHMHQSGATVAIVSKGSGTYRPYVVGDLPEKVGAYVRLRRWLNTCAAVMIPGVVVL